MNCDDAMSKKASSVSGVPTSPMTITYSSSTTNIVWASTYTELFTTADLTNCPLSSCTLKNSACSGAMATSTNFFLTTGSTPYAVSAK